MGAEPTGSDAAAEDAAVGTPLRAQVASFAGRAFVHHHPAGGPLGDEGDWYGMPAAPEGLAAGCRADALAAAWHEGLLAYRAGYRYAIVTQRAVRLHWARSFPQRDAHHRLGCAPPACGTTRLRSPR